MHELKVPTNAWGGEKKVGLLAKKSKSKRTMT